METAVIVGIFTLVGTLAGVAIGAILNYWFLERSRRREREDLVREETIDRLNEFYSSLAGIHYCLLQSRKVLTNAEKIALTNIQTGALSRYTKAHGELFKSYFKMKKYTKGGPILKSFREFWKEVEVLINLHHLTENYLNYAEIKDDNLIKQLVDQLEKVYDRYTILRDALLAD